MKAIGSIDKLQLDKLKEEYERNKDNVLSKIKSLSPSGYEFLIMVGFIRDITDLDDLNSLLGCFDKTNGIFRNIDFSRLVAFFNSLNLNKDMVSNEDRGSIGNALVREDPIGMVCKILQKIHIKYELQEHFKEGYFFDDKYVLNQFVCRIANYQDPILLLNKLMFVNNPLGMFQDLISKVNRIITSDDGIPYENISDRDMSNILFDVASRIIDSHYKEQSSAFMPSAAAASSFAARPSAAAAAASSAFAIEQKEQKHLCEDVFPRSPSRTA